MKDVPKPDEKELTKTEAIIRSMTAKERKNHTIINPSRRKRIAAGSGTQLAEVNRVLKSYSEMLKMMKKMRGKPGAMTGVKRRKVPKGMKRR
jgi:signal recognition particle subunit SRP54